MDWKNYMTRFRLNFSWIDPLGAKGDEFRATWAQLEIIVDGQVLSRLLDDDLNAVRNHIYLPLYPVAEWLAENWWSLFYEAETDAPRPGALERHNLRFAGEGFFLPDLGIYPVGDLLQLTWRSGTRQGWAGEFLRSGSTTLPRAVVKGELNRFVEAVLARLDERGITDTYLARTWNEIHNLQPDQLDFCRTAGALGLDPFSLNEEAVTAIIDAHEQLEKLPGFHEDVEREFFQSANLDCVREQSHDFFHTADRLVKAAVPVNGSLSSTDLKLHSDQQPWAEGYRLAREVREQLGLQDHRFNGLADLKARVTTSDLPIIDMSPASLPRAAFTRTENRAAFGLPQSSFETGRIFSFARAVGSFLATSRSLGIVTGSQTYEQKMNRAFAAELLAPAHLLEDHFAGRLITDDSTEEIASQLSVSPLVIQHQVENHGLGKFNF